jgi:protein TonB
MSLYFRKDPRIDLESTHGIYLRLGAITSLLIFIILFRIEFTTETEFEVAVVEQEVVTVEDIVMTRQDEMPPPPPRPSAPVEVTNDAVIEDEFLDFSAEIDFDAMAFVASAPPPTDEPEEEEQEIFIVVERMPELVGGLEALQRNIVYPEIARLAGIEGRVTVQFVIDERGNVLNPVVVRGIGGGCDEAAVDAVKKAKFTPGMQRGRPVKVSYTLPVTFRLSTAEKKPNS